jgi:hypothetical protein
MRIMIIACLLLLVVPAYADELDDNAAICMQHRPSKEGDGIVRIGPVSQWKYWLPGWEHCQSIYEQKVHRDATARDADETANPDLKKTRDFSKTITGK